jgi:hypothetical protein
VFCSHYKTNPAFFATIFFLQAGKIILVYNVLKLLYKRYIFKIISQRRKARKLKKSNLASLRLCERQPY